MLDDSVSKVNVIMPMQVNNSIYDPCVLWCIVSSLLFYHVLIFLQNITMKTASIVEPLGFSDSLPIMFVLCYILCNTIFRQIKMFCSVLLLQM